MFLSHTLLSILSLLMYYVFIDVYIFMMRFDVGCPERDMWIFHDIYELCFIHRVLVHFSNETLPKFR